MAFFAEISGVENQIYRSRSGISNLRSRYFPSILSAGVVRNLKSAAGVDQVRSFSEGVKSGTLRLRDGLCATDNNGD